MRSRTQVNFSLENQSKKGHTSTDDPRPKALNTKPLWHTQLLNARTLLLSIHINQRKRHCWHTIDASGYNRIRLRLILVETRGDNLHTWVNLELRMLSKHARHLCLNPGVVEFLHGFLEVDSNS